MPVRLFSQASPPSALAQIQRHPLQRQSLERIQAFARGVLVGPTATSATPTEREAALALLFGLGVSRGSVHDLLDVAALLAQGPGEGASMAVPLLSRIPSVQALWQRLAKYEHQYELCMPNPFEPDAPEMLIAVAGGATPGGSSTAADDSGQGAVRFVGVERRWVVWYARPQNSE